MSKKVGFSYFVLGLSCFLLLNARLHFIEKIRGPFFGFEDLFASRAMSEDSIEIAELKAENLQIKKRLKEVQHYLTSSDHIENIYNKCVFYEDKSEADYSSFFKRRLNQVIDLLNTTRWQVSANVIYRDPANWGSALWVDVGVNENKKYDKEIIAPGSPVVVGDQLIGVIEQVDMRRSKIRLITDAKLTPAVRCLRGKEPHAILANYCTKLKQYLRLNKSKRSDELIIGIDSYLDRAANFDTTDYLAKGFVMGSSQPLWRSRSLVLQGIGFNYDFGDEENPPVSLHTKEGKNLFAPGDFLVTSGMDGVFPPNLLVAVVTKVSELKEGAVSCDLLAEILLPEFNSLQKVTILPPIDLKNF